MIAAVLTPFSILFDFPSVAERRYIKDGIPHPDPRVNLILSSIALAFSVVANLLLVVRLSLTGQDWRNATSPSCFCWFIKFLIAEVIISTVNIAVFGVIIQAETYEGFWYG
ncbi:hypothetical protein FRB96_009704 [Tulasnella sp. 330]|nr:hypothetical protein FRB96_009704 [Tulasnella sp. 330]